MCLCDYNVKNPNPENAYEAFNCSKYFFWLTKKKFPQTSVEYNIHWRFLSNHKQNENDNDLKICEGNIEAWSTIAYAQSGFYSFFVVGGGNLNLQFTET